MNSMSAVKMCRQCPLCRFTRNSKSNSLLYRFARLIQRWCPSCRAANREAGRNMQESAFLGLPRSVKQYYSRSKEVPATQQRLRLQGFEVEVHDEGSQLWVGYIEQKSSYRFFFKLGSGETIVIMAVPPPADWDAECPHLKGRRVEVLNRVVGGLCEQRIDFADEVEVHIGNRAVEIRRRSH